MPLSASPLPQTATLSPDRLPGLDVADALSRLGGDQSFYLALLASFVEDYDPRMDSIRQVLAGTDRDQIAALAHAVKGVAANVSAVEVAAAARRLQQEARSASDTELRQLAAALVGSLTETLDTLRHFLGGTST